MSPPPSRSGPAAIAVTTLLFALCPAPPAGAAAVERDQQRCAAMALRSGQFSVAPWPETDFCRHSVDLGEIRSGGPPPDGIPPIDAPKWESVRTAGKWLQPREPVILFAHGGESRIYPLQIMTWHEIVNDDVGGLPVTVTFCPLCYTALVFARPVHQGQVLSFGVSGNLRHSDMIMWDRQTHSWWQQFDGRAIVGTLTGERLTQLPANLISWADASRRAPAANVLSRDTGHRRPYGENPYVGYDDTDAPPILFDGRLDERHPPMARIVGVTLAAGSAYRTYAALQASQIDQATVGGVPLLFVWEPGVASALNSREIANGKEIGWTAVYDRRLGEQTLTFTRQDQALRDTATGSTWTPDGRAVAGPLQGSQLTLLPHHDTFWFAWAAFTAHQANDAP